MSFVHLRVIPLLPCFGVSTQTLVSTQTWQDIRSGETGSSKDEHMLMVLAQTVFFVLCLWKWSPFSLATSLWRACVFVVGLKPRILFKSRVLPLVTPGSLSHFSSDIQGQHLISHALSLVVGVVLCLQWVSLNCMDLHLHPKDPFYPLIGTVQGWG